MAYSGNVNSKLSVSFEKDTCVQQSCTIKYRGEFWIFGGSPHSNQVSTIRSNNVFVNMNQDQQDTKL